jgi:hypothetical protein
MDRVFSYKGFNIRAFEKDPDRWSAEIRKTNGAWIVVRGERREVLTTSASREPMNAKAEHGDTPLCGERQEAPASCRSGGTDRRRNCPTIRCSVLADHLARLNASSTEDRRLSFWKPLTPALANGEDAPPLYLFCFY